MNIIRKSHDLTPEQTFKMTKSPSIKKLSEIKGNDIFVNAFIEYEDENLNTGEVSRVMAFDVDGLGFYATNSKTFIRGFGDIVDIYGDAITWPIHVAIGTDRSKAGREYLKCDLV